MRSLIRWAKAVADGEPIEPIEPNPDDRSSLREQFRLLADIARAHRSFVEEPSENPSSEQPAPSTRSWGHLELRALIGRGSFGDVYEAWDHRLERPVALKLLYRDHEPQDDAAAIQEGRLLARVHHPHVVAVYGADRIDGRVGISMELIQGRTLEDIVSNTGPLSAQEATVIGLDVCRAVAAVHQAGLLHRDIKARNVMRAHGGRIVLMDFGAGRHGSSSSIAAGSEPQTADGGGADLIGTPLYLAPEIFDGAAASVRSDVYSIGVLLFYLVTGRTPVAGDSARDVRQAHRLERRVSLREARPDLPEEFIGAVQRALAPKPEDRPASAAELAERLLRTSTDGASRAADRVDRSARSDVTAPSTARGRGLLAAVARRRPPRSVLLPIAVAASLVLGWTAGLFSSRAIWRTPTRAREARFTIPLPPIVVDSLAASPDGQRLAMTGTDASGVSRLWLRPLEATDARPLAGTEGATGAFWSADSRALGYFAKGKLWIVSAAGGAPRALADAAFSRGAAWSDAGDIVFAPVTRGPLLRVSTSGGAPTPVTAMQAGEVSHRWPTFDPDGRRVLFLCIARHPLQTGTCVVPRDGGPVQRIATIGSNVAVTPGGLLFADGPVLLTQGFVPGDLRAIGEPRALARDLIWHADQRQALFAWSKSGLLAYGAGEPLETELTAYSRAGVPLFTRRLPGLVRSFALSPDGTRVVLQRLDPAAGSDDIWVLDLGTEMLARLTFDPANDTDPVWSADGREILFSSDRMNETYHLFRRSANAGGAETLFSDANGRKYAEDWSADGRAVLFVGGDEGAREIFVAVRDDATHPRPLLDVRAQFLVDEPAFSPDGRFVAYHSTESGQPEVFITAIDNPSARWQVSRGGVQPRWRADGRELFYLSLDGRVMGVPLTRLPREAGWRAGVPAVLVDARIAHNLLVNDYAARRDGDLFLVKREIGGRVSRLNVILNGEYGK